MTSSPGPISSASSTSTSASVPFAQLTVSCTPSRAAASRSNDSTSGPKMKRPVSSVRANASWRRGISGAYCALTSTWGIDIARAHRSRASPPQDQVRHEQHDPCDDGELAVAEIVVQGVPVRAEGPPGSREDGAPDAVPDQREDVVPDERALEDAGGNRDERPRDGRHPADEDRPRVPPGEPALGVVELARRQVEPAPMALEERAAAADPDPPAEDRAELVPDDAGEDDGVVGAEAAPVPAEDVDAMCERARRERARVHHHELARSGEKRVDEH